MPEPVPPEVLDAYRRGSADAVVKLKIARFWPNVRIEDMAKVACVEYSDLQAALARARVPRPTAPPKPLRPTSKRRPPAPEGMHWCVRHRQGEGGFVLIADMGKNRSRPDGLSDYCKACWRDLWRDRRASRSDEPPEAQPEE